MSAVAETERGDFTADPRLVGLLGRAGVMEVWLHATREEQTRDSGWLTGRLKGLRTRLTR